MKLELTTQQEQVVKQGRPVEVLEPMSKRVFVVVTRELYEHVRSLLEREEQATETWEPVVPDTDHAWTVQQLAQAWNAIGRPVTEDEVSLSVDPDEYPLF